MGKLGALTPVLALALVFGLVSGGNFYEQVDTTWGAENCWPSDAGNSLSLALVSKGSGAGIRSKKQFIYGTVSTMLQLVKDNSAGTVTTFYTSSSGEYHDEIDFEFLGNASGQPYTVHTNVYANGVGEKEMQFRLWFDPTNGYHNYTISWTPCMIVWYVDSVPIRVFRNYQQSHGVAFPTSQPMYAHSTIWSADWATQGGRVQTNWSKAPFVANFHGIDLAICECYGGDCIYSCAGAYGGQQYCPGLSNQDRWKMQWVQDNLRIYNYCEGYPGPECSLPQY